MAMEKSSLVMPMHYVELDREEMAYVEGGDYHWSKETCFNILLASGVIAYFGSVATILVGGTALYYSVLSFMGFATAALSANPVTAPIGLTIAGFLITKGIEFVTCLVMGACNNGMTIETLKIWRWDTGIPKRFSY